MLSVKRFGQPAARLSHRSRFRDSIPRRGLQAYRRHFRVAKPKAVVAPLAKGKSVRSDYSNPCWLSDYFQFDHWLDTPSSHRNAEAFRTPRRRFVRVASLLLILALLLPAHWLLADSHRGAAQPQAVANPWRMQGSASCASMACHNAELTSGFQGREYGLVLARFPNKLQYKDKHLQAYDVLFNDKSQTILRNLDGKPHLADVSASVRHLCLKCHVHPDVEVDNTLSLARQEDLFRYGDGVGCEACHGPAQGWLAAHFRPGWKGLDAASKKSFGRNDTAGIVNRLQTCVRCHIGDRDASVNHDLLAAGHPELKFEAAKYHREYPRHWDPAKDLLRHRNFDAELANLGQLVAARAALDQIAHHASESQGGVWPELAAFDCASCHHKLESKSPRLLAGRGGKPMLMERHFGGVEKALEYLEGDAGTWRAELAILRELIEKPSADRKTVQVSATKLAKWLDGTLASRAP